MKTTEQFDAIYSTNPKISVITNHYNVDESYIRRAIESIQNQTFTDFEYIISDNASTDNTALILDEYASKDSRIKIIHQKENQPVKAFEEIICNVAKGEYIAFLDNDDYYEPDFLETMYNLAKETDADLIACGTEMYKEEDKKQRGVRTYKDVYVDDFRVLVNSFKDVVWVAYATIWCKLFRRKIAKHMIEKNTFAGFASYHDTMFCLAYALHSESLAITSKVLHHYCMRSNSQVYKWSKDHLAWADGTFLLFKQCLRKWSIETPENMIFISDVLLGNIYQILDSINKSNGVEIEKALDIISDIANDVNLHEAAQYSQCGSAIYKDLILTVWDIIIKIRSQEDKEKIRQNFLYRICYPLLLTQSNSETIAENLIKDYLDALYCPDNKYALGKQYLPIIIKAYNEGMYEIIKYCDLDFLLDNSSFIYDILNGKEQYPILNILAENKLIQRYADIVCKILNQNYRHAFELIIDCFEEESSSKAKIALLETARILAALDEYSPGFILASKYKIDELIADGDYGNAAALVLELENMLPGDEDILYFRIILLIRCDFLEEAKALAVKIKSDNSYSEEIKAKTDKLFS